MFSTCDRDNVLFLSIHTFLEHSLKHHLSWLPNNLRGHHLKPGVCTEENDMTVHPNGINLLQRLLILIMKGICLARCFVFMLISLNVDARPWTEIKHRSEGQEEKSINSIRLFEEVGMISREACIILPSDLMPKCLEMTEAYVHRATLALKGFLNEEILCNLTDLCIKKTMTDERSCTTCRRAVKDLIYQLNQSKIRMRIMDALLEYCEDAEDSEEHCKETVYKYAPLVLHKLDKAKPNEICRVIGFCDEGLSI